MTDIRPHKTPGPDHPITLDRSSSRVIVKIGTHIVATTDRSFEMKEAAYPPVRYIPFDDIDRKFFRVSDHHTYCPYKGEASYFDLVDESGAVLAAAVWYYDEPFSAVAEIKDCVAFYSDLVEITIA